MCMAAQTSSIYRGEGGCAPFRVSTPKRRRPALDPIKGGGQGEERGGRPTRWALGPSVPRVSPFPPSCALGLLWGGAPAHLGLVPSHTWSTQPSGAGGPTWWTPGTLPVVPVHYRFHPKLFR